jgi:hypothetical protein
VKLGERLGAAEPLEFGKEVLVMGLCDGHFGTWINTWIWFLFTQ